ncbi:MAG: hypothetical protein HC880_18625 [Bacteroidia bacterium]|nr:hypothetical protein [Bacteroidia bacterium]
MENPHALDTAEVVEALEAKPEQGLDQAEVEKRQKEYGPNKLAESEQTSIWAILLDQVKKPRSVLTFCCRHSFI